MTELRHEFDEVPIGRLAEALPENAQEAEVIHYHSLTVLAMEVQAATTKKIGEVTKELAIQAPTQSAEKQMTN